jgi:hypothetical protein
VTNLTVDRPYRVFVFARAVLIDYFLNRIVFQSIYSHSRVYHLHTGSDSIIDDWLIKLPGTLNVIIGFLYALNASSWLFQVECNFTLDFPLDRTMTEATDLTVQSILFAAA